MVKFKVRDVYRALEANGFEHLREEWTADDMDGVIRGGCVLQQAGMNLGVVVGGEDEDDSNSLLRKLDALGQVPSNSKWVVSEYGSSPTIGEAIIYWNDKYEWVYNPKTQRDERRYALKTYKQVAKMAYDLLEPYMDKSITLKEKDWNYKRKKGAAPFELKVEAAV